MIQNKEEIILTGDFNAKLEIKQGNYQQTRSPNGKHLETLIRMNNLHSLATKAKNIGWTRQNRNKIEEKSIIDYILTTEKISNCANLK